MIPSTFDDSSDDEPDPLLQNNISQLRHASPKSPNAREYIRCCSRETPREGVNLHAATYPSVRVVQQPIESGQMAQEGLDDISGQTERLHPEITFASFQFWSPQKLGTIAGDLVRWLIY